MKKVIASLLVIALVAGAVWFVMPTIKANAVGPVDTELVPCKLPADSRPYMGRSGLVTRLECQNLGGRVVDSCP